ncbi:uncharacterized protein LOC115216260 [Argonauta hians]
MARTATMLIVFATILGPITLILLCLSFATDKWLEFKVNSTMLTPNTINLESNFKYKKVLHSRYEGLFRECFPGSVRFPENTPGLTDGYCIDMAYSTPDSQQMLFSLPYNQRIHLMRTRLAFLAIGILTYLLAYIFGIAVCCSRASKWAILATIFAFSTAFCVAVAMAAFHGMEYLERNKITDEIGDIIFRKIWPSDLIAATSRHYGYSYVVGWVSLILACITGILYAAAAWHLKGERYREQQGFDTKSRVSDFAYTNYPMVATITEPVYNPYDDPRLVYAYPDKRTGNNLMIDASARDMWRWSAN